MNTLQKILIFAVTLAAVACQKSDANKDYGFAKIYIPQATTTGLDNSYPIPAGPFYQNSTYTCSYDKSSGKLKIALGVIRSGYFKNQKAYSVDLAADAGETARKLAEYQEKGTPAAELSLSLCTIPGKLSVAEGESGGTCYVEVDMKALSLQRSSLFTMEQYKLLVLGLGISNLQGPEEYALSETGTTVVIVLDLNSEHWDNVPENKPESEIRNLFPTSY